MCGKIKRSGLIAGSLLLLGALLLPVPRAVQAAVPGTNGKLAFQSSRDGDVEIFTMNNDGTGQTQLTFNSAGESVPSWSPDGEKIAFASSRDGGQNEIYVMNADGSNQTRLTNNSAIDATPDWTPDGEKIVFHSNRDGNNEIYIMNADGTGQTRLTNSAGDDTFPETSPDGTQIAFYSNRDGNLEVYVMDVDGTDQTRLANNANTDGDPAWSPDSSKIVFISTRDGNGEIYTMNRDGTNQTRITNNSAGDQSPEWSPDGQKIAFYSNRDGNNEIYLMDVDGTDQTRLTNDPGADTSPNWQPINEAPVTVNDDVTTAVGSAITIDVLLNDSDDTDLDSASLQIMSAATNGNASVQAGKVVYTPNTGYVGDDTFNYQVCDDRPLPLCSVGTVIVHVVPNVPNTGAPSHVGALLIISGSTMGVCAYFWRKTRRV